MTHSCTDCGRAAFFSCVQDGVQSYLCAPCASVRAGYFGLQELVSALTERRRSNRACPFCGATGESIEASGLVGCPLCYEAMEGVIKRVFSVG